MELEQKTIEFRLNSIERTLSELKDVLIENKMQNRDIEDLKNKTKEFLNAVNAHDLRLRVLEERPLKEKAGRWSLITDNFLKTIIGIAIAILLAKVGFSTGGI